MGLLDDLETQLEQEIPLQLQAKLQQALDHYQPRCAQCALAMHRHHRYDRTIVTSYGPIRIAVPVFRCGQCRQLAGGAALLGAEVRYQRFSKKLGTGL